MASCTFLETFPAEIRAKIYGHIFEHQSKAIKPIENDDDVPVSTAVLAVNKLVHEESIVELYRDKAVRVTTAQLQSLLEHKEFRALIRNVEIVDWFKASETPKPHPVLPAVIDDLHTLPTVKSIHLLVDNLALVDSNTSQNGHVTVRALDNNAQLGFGDLRCTDIGRYSFGTKNPKLHVVHAGLVSLWSDATESSWSSAFDGYAEACALLEQWQALPDCRNGPIWAAQTSMRLFVRLVEQAAELIKQVGSVQAVLAALQGADLDAAKARRMAFFARFYCALRGLVDNSGERVLVRGDGDARDLALLDLHKLGPHSNAEILEWVTEFLAANLVAYRRGAHAPERLIAAYEQPAHWSQLSGGQHYGEYMFREHRVVVAGSRNSSHWFRGAFDEDTVHDASSAMEYVLATEVGSAATRCNPDHTFSTRDIQELYALHQALTELNRPDQAAFDVWAKGLLKRYLLASGGATGKELRDVSVDRLRDLMGSAVDTLNGFDLQTDDAGATAVVEAAMKAGDIRPRVEEFKYAGVYLLFVEQTTVVAAYARLETEEYRSLGRSALVSHASE